MPAATVCPPPDAPHDCADTRYASLAPVPHRSLRSPRRNGTGTGRPRCRSPERRPVAFGARTSARCRSYPSRPSPPKARPAPTNGPTASIREGNRLRREGSNPEPGFANLASQAPAHRRLGPRLRRTPDHAEEPRHRPPRRPDQGRPHRPRDVPGTGSVPAFARGPLSWNSHEPARRVRSTEGGHGSRWAPTGAAASQHGRLGRCAGPMASPTLAAVSDVPDRKGTSHGDHR
jgi:hypothetical protein